MKAKRITLDEFNYELVVTALWHMMNKSQIEGNKSAKNNYQTCLADIKEEPWVEI